MFGRILVCCLAMAAFPAWAADVVVLTPNPFAPIFEELRTDFERATGDKIVLVRDTAGGVANRIGKGEAFDIAVLGVAAAKKAAGDGKLAVGSDRPVGTSSVGLAVKDGAPIPKIDTVEAFKAVLLSARAVAYTDPASGGSSGIYLSQLWPKLGIAEQMKAKAVLVPGGLAAERIANGQADVALQQAGELMSVKGARYVGLIPAEIQFVTSYAVGISAASARAGSAKTLVDMLLGAKATEAMSHHGLARP